MTTEERYNPHVAIYSPPPNLESATWDGILAGILILLASLSFPANILAFHFFWSNSRRNLASILYLAISVIDVCSSLAHLPVCAPLLNGRRPMLFDSVTFCAAWNIFFSFLLEMSTFLVLLLSVSRTIAIILPFKKVSKNAVIASFVLYPVINLTLDFVAYRAGITYVYGSDGPYCYELESDYTLHKPIVKTILKISNVRSTIQLGVPPIIIFLSFLVSVYKLALGNRLLRNSQRAMRRATVTIAMVTGLFLMSNLPYFTLYTLETITFLGFNYPGPLFSSTFMFFYSWTIGKILMLPLNATLNPILYYFRMSGFRRWILGRFRELNDTDGKS
jgi:hypothetical protein